MMMVMVNRGMIEDGDDDGDVDDGGDRDDGVDDECDDDDDDGDDDARQHCHSSPAVRWKLQF